MITSSKIQPTHLQREAIVYLRQSSPRQVVKNQESAVNQRALQERLRELGWKQDQISVIDDDQGQSAAHAAGREGFQRLAADVGLRKVGIIMGYEVSRLSRNCADWHRLLDLCALFDTLIADADGIYHPRDFNDRLLLGLKGTMSEAELHSLKLRLEAGRLSKAKRGELIQFLPTGYVRQPDRTVCRDPDQGIQSRISLVFTQFHELGSVHKVLRYFVRHELKVPRRQMAGPRTGEVLWKAPYMEAFREILKNPAYAGAFAYGRRATDPTRCVPGRPGTGHLRQPPSRWVALVKNVYPAYISWEQYEQNQLRIKENWQNMLERLMSKRGQHATAPLLVGLVRCGHCGHAMRVTYKGSGIQYACTAAQSQQARPSCQFVSGVRIDHAVVQEFFRVLHAAEIDALDRVSRRQAERQRELFHQLEQEVARLEYAAQRAERQYNCVDPENRLIASTLEKKWENALVDLERARLQLKEEQSRTIERIRIPPELREQIADLGRRLPEVWEGLSSEGRRRLLRTLVRGVNLRRDDDGMAQVRIVWQGNHVTETSVCVPVTSIKFSKREKEIVARISELIAAGNGDAAIAAQLNAAKRRPCRGGIFTWRIVLKMRCRHGLRLRLGQVREGNLPEGYTIRELTSIIGVDSSWFYHRIGNGMITISKHPAYKCYLFPRNGQTIRRLQQIRLHKQRQASFPTEHCHG